MNKIITAGYNLKKNNKGSATIVALITGVVIMAFALSLLLVAYSLYSSVSRQNIQEQCRQIAESVAVSLQTELEADDNNLAEYFKEQRERTDSGQWVAVTEDSDSEEDDSVPAVAEGKEELVMTLTNSANKATNYEVKIIFTYSTDGSSGDDDFDDTDEPDDEEGDEGSPGDGVPGEGAPGGDEGPEDWEDNAVKVLHAKIIVSRGLEGAIDLQEVIIKKDYRNIDF